MKSFVIDAQTAGASGDMFLSALLALQYTDVQDSLSADKKRETLINSIAEKIPAAADLEGKAALTVKLERKSSNALNGIHLKIDLTEPARHLHFPQAMTIVKKLSKTLDLSKDAKTFSEKAIRMLFEAESKAHNEPLEKVHLHEAGSLDTFLDVVGSAYLLDQLELFDAFLYLHPIAIGSGTVTFSHGTLPVPAPAVAEILQKYRLPVTTGTVATELLTPTGAIIIASLAEMAKAKSLDSSPAMIIEHIGVGFGKKEFKNVPNGLRLLVGTTTNEGFEEEILSIVETNIDDCSGETIGYISQKLLDMGAKDVFLTPIYMKKGRPGTKVTVLCSPDKERIFAKELIAQTSTIGVRMMRSSKIMLAREIRTFTVKLEGKSFEVRGKIAFSKDGKIIHLKPEFDDVKNIADTLGLKLLDVNAFVQSTIRDLLQQEK